MNLLFVHNNILRTVSMLSVIAVIASCGGGGGTTNTGATAAPAVAAAATLSFDIKTFRFTWTDVNDATFYRVLENPDGLSGFTQVGNDIAQGTQTYDHSVTLYQRTAASYLLQSCNSIGCTDSSAINITTTLAPAIGYFKASNTDSGDFYGLSVALSADGTTLAIGAPNEDSAANTIDGDESDATVTATDSGAVYVYAKNLNLWTKQAYIKAGNSSAGDQFGTSVSLSSDGNLLAVGAPLQANTGSVYTFTRTGITWSQQDSVKASPAGIDNFGNAVSLSADGATLAVGAKSETSSTTGIGSTDDNDPAITLVGAAYIFTNNAGNWQQQEYIKADNAGPGDFFGSSVYLNSDGNTLAVGAPGEASSTNGISTTAAASDNAFSNAGASYVFTRDTNNAWTQQAYIKTSNPDPGDNFGEAVSLSADGNTLSVGAPGEDSIANTIDGDDTDDTALQAGAAFVFSRTATVWTQQAYIKPGNTDAGDSFGRAVSLSASGDLLAVGASNEQSNATGVNGDTTDNSINFNNGAGAAYVYSRDMTSTWTQQAYIKSSNAADNDFYGAALAMNADGSTLAVSARNEDSDSTGIGGDTTNAGSLGSGAVFLY